LAETLQDYQPGSPYFVLLLDRVDGYFSAEREPFRLIKMEELGLAKLARFRFQYTPFELSCAAKPYFMEHVFESYGVTKLVYLDTDILVLNELQPLERLLDQHAIVLTPHLDVPYCDGKHPGEVMMLRSGAYNGGFLAASKSPTTRAFLGWWRERLETGCQAAIEQGLFVDQKWLDLVPGMFDGVHILREPGYNAAYWNLHCRKVTARDDKFFANGAPCYVFHFSGYDPADSGNISKHQNRFTMADVGDARLLYDWYKERLLAHQHSITRHWPYTFAAFDNGVRIAPFVRRLYLKLGDQAAIYGDPFSTRSEHSFFSWLNGFQDGDLSPLLREVYSCRPDLISHFPDPSGKDRKAYLQWFLTNGKQEFDLDSGLLTEARLALESSQVSGLGRRFRMKTCPTRLPVHILGLNVLGNVQSEKGVGEACRSTLRSLEAASVPFALCHWADGTSANRDRSFTHFTTDNPYPINLIQLNADAAPLVAQALPSYLQGRFNIGYWNWELAWFPPEWQSSFQYFDEIWAPSEFTRAALTAVSPIPVQRVPFSIAVPQFFPDRLDRRRFNLRKDAFVFLFAFDFQSIFARKNPLAVIAAFRRAFARRRDVLLVLKLVHAEAAPMEFAHVLAACGGQANIRIINEVLGREEMYALTALSDAYVALHRSEGYGLVLAEAMAMGKPVIATGYSANTDFMNATNSLPVHYELVTIDQDHGPYRRGARWAEPDIDHAALQMCKLVEDRGLARRLGAAAREDIRQQLSPAVVGVLIQQRLRAIREGWRPENRYYHRRQAVAA
jgi:glycosyltransferase involved in cell wall biosynthesis